MLPRKDEYNLINVLEIKKSYINQIFDRSKTRSIQYSLFSSMIIRQMHEHVTKSLTIFILDKIFVLLLSKKTQRF